MPTSHRRDIAPRLGCASSILVAGAAAMQARMALLARAAKRLGVQAGSLEVHEAIVSVRGENGFRKVAFGELVGDKPFNLKYDGTAQ